MSSFALEADDPGAPQRLGNSGLVWDCFGKRLVELVVFGNGSGPFDRLLHASQIRPNWVVFVMYIAQIDRLIGYLREMEVDEHYGAVWEY